MKRVKSLTITAVLLILVFFSCFAVFLNFNKNQKVNAETFTYANESARTFNSQTSFICTDDTTNGNNGFFAMCGQTCQNLADGLGNKAPFESPISNTKFTTVLSKTYTAEDGEKFYQGAYDYTLVGETAMLVDLDSLQTTENNEIYGASEVPVRGFKFPMSGKATVTVTAWMDEVQRNNSLTAVVSHNTTYLNDIALLQDFDSSGTTDANDKWEYTASLQVTANDMLYVEVHNGTSTSTDTSKAHTVIEVVYTDTTDSAVICAKEEIASLPTSDFNHSHASSIMSVYDKIALMSDLQRSFITEEEGERFSTAYEGIKGVASDKIYSSYDSYSDTAQGAGNFYYMHGENNDPTTFTECSETVTHSGIVYWQGTNTYTCINKTEMVIGCIDGDIEGETDKGDYPVKAFKAPKCGNVTVLVTGWTNLKVGFNEDYDAIFQVQAYHNKDVGLNGLNGDLETEIATKSQAIHVAKDDYIYIQVTNTDNERSYIASNVNLTVIYTDEIHVYDAECDKICNDCGYERTLSYNNSSSLTLAGDIGVNLYVDVVKYTNDADAYVELTYKHGTNYNSALSTDIIYIKNLSAEEDDGTYKFTVTVASGQISDKINLTLYDSQGNELYKVEDYSVLAYCEKVINDGSQSENLINLCKSIINYGKYAKEYFGYDSENVITSQTIEGAPTQIENLPSSSETDNLDTLSVYKYSLVALSNVSVRVYFVMSYGQNLSDYTIDVSVPDGTNTNLNFKTGSNDVGYYVEIYNIEATNIDTTFTVTISYGNQSLIINYSALNFINDKLNDANITDPLKNLCMAIYTYNYYSDLYFND